MRGVGGECCCWLCCAIRMKYCSSKLQRDTHLIVTTALLCFTISRGVQCFSLYSSPPSSVDGHITVCPGTNVTLTCTASDTATLGWNDQYGQIEVFVSSNPEPTVINKDPYILTLVMVEDDDGDFLANFTSTLEVTVYENITISCVIYQNRQNIDISVTNIPSRPSNVVIAHIFQKHHFFTNVSWKIGDDEFIKEYRLATHSITIVTNQTSTIMEGRYNAPMEISIRAVNCIGSSQELKTEINITGCGAPSSPVNGSISGWTSSQVGAQVNYTCDGDLVLEGEVIAVCSKPSYNWIPRSEEVNCTYRSHQHNCESPEFLQSFVSFDEQNKSFSCVNGYQFSNHLYSVCTQGKWTVNPIALECNTFQRLNHYENETDKNSCNIYRSNVVIHIVIAVISAICSFAGALLLCLVLYCLRVKCNQKKRQGSEMPPAVIYEDISLEDRPCVHLNSNEAYGNRQLFISTMKSVPTSQ